MASFVQLFEKKLNHPLATKEKKGMFRLLIHLKIA